MDKCKCGNPQNVLCNFERLGEWNLEIFFGFYLICECGMENP